MAVLKATEFPMSEISPEQKRRIANLGNLMVVVCEFTNGPAMYPDKLHSHPHEQITYVEEGDLYLFVGDEKHHLSKGDLFTIPSGTLHGIQTISSLVRLIDSFSPIREDFIINP
jgi:quercetin dioxygenase-like cupin family protein